MKSSLVAPGEVLHSKLTNYRGFKKCMIGQANGLAFSKVVCPNIHPFRKAVYLDNNYEYFVDLQFLYVICYACKKLN